ncbi:hydantoinase/oxoprolinase family protein [Alcaligenaceae bacterium CGII-47]|nr:hydantoinase/oxoprolinase family protein [Alcaligenaceae bacterium CGII-47]
MEQTTTQGVLYQVGVDIGGTFTDIVLLGDDGTICTRKVLSTPDDYGRGIVEGIQNLLVDQNIQASNVRRVVHATTVATNAILENQQTRIGLITTRGFRDVLEMRRLRIPEMYTLNYARPEPLVPRHLRYEVTERIGPRGEIWEPLDEHGVHDVVAHLKQADVEAVAISLLHSYANPEHEKRIHAIVREQLSADVFITSSHEILPVIREYERTSTTVINAFLGPTLTRYFESLARHLRDIGVHVPVQVMKSDGGLMSIDIAAKKPAYLIESGPAAGVIGAARLGDLMAQPDSISFDMGGTTAKSSMVEAGEVARTADYEVGAGINLSSKLVMGGGYALKLPVIDISEIGAGGGSLAVVDQGGLLRVGPKSAGSMPGPVAYDLGGTEPTFSDAVITLGYINPEYLAGGQFKLNAAKAREALQTRIADAIGSDVMQAAYGIYEVACTTMTRAVKAISTYRGRDPRDFSLFTFGGNGPVVGARLADMLEMRRVIIPPNPGVFSALGLLMAKVEHESVIGFMHNLSEVGEATVNTRIQQLKAELAEQMQAEGYSAGEVQYSFLADMRYIGQAHELTVHVPVQDDGKLVSLHALAHAFSNEHHRTYGHRADDQAVECVTLRAIGSVKPKEVSWAQVLRLKDYQASQAPRTRDAYFGREHGLMSVPVLKRADLSVAQEGPFIVEEYDSTTVVPPGWSARLQDMGTICLESNR